MTTDASEQGRTPFQVLYARHLNPWLEKMRAKYPNQEELVADVFGIQRAQLLGPRTRRPPSWQLLEKIIEVTEMSEGDAQAFRAEWIYESIVASANRLAPANRVMLEELRKRCRPAEWQAIVFRALDAFQQTLR